MDLLSEQDVNDDDGRADVDVDDDGDGVFFDDDIVKVD